MQAFLFSALMLGNILYAVSLDAIIDNALASNPSLQSINERIAANKESINLASQFANPELLLRINDINLDDPTNRSIEPMQWMAVDFSQKLPYFGKRDAEKKIAIAQENVLIENLDSAKSALVGAIKSQAYSIWELERLVAIIGDYEDLTRQNIELYEAYTSTSDDQHMGIMSAELTLSNLRIQKSRLHSLITSAYARLSYFSVQEISKLKIELDVTEMPPMALLKEELKNNRNVAIRESEVRKELAALERAKLDHYPDTSIQAGYYYRESFDDYLSVGIGLSLPIYGSEDYKEEHARRLMLAKKSEKADTVMSVDTKFESVYANMKNAYETYRIITDESLPQIGHMFDLSNSSVRVGGDLFKYIDILEQKLRLEQQSVSAVAAYHRARAEIAQLTGEMK